MQEDLYLKNKFNDNVLKAVEESKKIGYVPARFIQILQQANNNAFDVVQNLVIKKATTGLETLWEKGRLDLSVEALIVKDEFKELFPEEVVKVCTLKLKKCGYKF